MGAKTRMLVHASESAKPMGGAFRLFTHPWMGGLRPMDVLRLFGFAACFSLLTQAASAQSDAFGIEPAAFCEASQKSVKDELRDNKGMPPPVREVLQMLVHERVCRCVSSRFALSGYRRVGNDLPSALRFLRANAACTSQNLREVFPGRCPMIYADLLPLLGYKDPSEKLVSQACGCATAVIGERLTEDALYAHQSAALMRSVGAEEGAVKAEGPAETNANAKDPLVDALQSLQGCIATAASTTQ